jgi:signal transduction histidine kinase
MHINRWQHVLVVSLGLWVFLNVPITQVLAAPIAPLADQSQQTPISLAGQWQFYWGKLLSPADFAATPDTHIAGESTIAVPSSWAGQVLGPDINEGKPLPYFGIATYRKQIIIPPDRVGSQMMLISENIGSAYRIWVNGTLVGGLGTLATTMQPAAYQVEVPQIRMNLISITPQSSNLDIIIQVSNYSFREGGIFGDLIINSAYATVQYVFSHFILQDLLLSGVFIVVGLYHIMIYLLGRRDSELLWLAGVCVSIALRTVLLNKFMIHLAVPNASWTQLIYWQYSMRFIALFTYLQLIRTLYRHDVNTIVHRICVAIWLGTMIYVFSTPPRVFTLTFNIQTIISVAILFYYLFVVGYTSLLRNREGARLNVVSLVFLIIAIIHDFYLFTNKLQSIQIVPYAILVTLLTQAIIISYRYTQFQQRNAQLAKDLQDINRNLEEKVIARTTDLNTSNARLVALTDQRSRLMANIAHDMGGPMIGVQSSLHILTTEILNTQEKEYLLDVFTKRLNYVKRLVDDLFRLAKLESRQLDFDWQDVVVPNFYTELSDYFGQIIRTQGQVWVHEHQCTNNVYVNAKIRIDKQQIYRVLQNLVDNAIKYSTNHESPIMMRSILREAPAGATTPYEWYVEIIDHGIGINAEHLPVIFERFYTRSNGLSGGSGLGLAICKEIIDRHDGTIGVHSVQGQGSTFYFTLPIAE